MEWSVSTTSGLGQGPAVLMVEQDAVEFVLRGRNVFHGFIVGDPWLKAGQTCFIVDEQGTLIGHGLAQCDADEALRFEASLFGQATFRRHSNSVT